MIRTKFLLIAVLLVVLSCLAFGTGKQESEKTTIEVWTLAGPQNTMWQEWKKIYEAENPNVTVSLTNQEQDNLKFMLGSALASKAEKLDVSFYWGGAAVDDWARNGLLADLTPYYKQYNWYNKKSPSAKMFSTEGLGDFYFTTDWVTAPHYYYNKDIFDKLSLTPPKTVPDFVALLQKLRAAGFEPWSIGGKDIWPGTHVLGDLLSRTMSADNLNRFNNWERDVKKSAQSAEVFRSPQAIEAWNLLKGFIDKNVFNTGANATDDSTARQLFIDGKAAIYSSGCWVVGILKNDAPKLNYDYFDFPGMDGKRPIGIAYNGIIVASSVGKRLPAVVKLLNSLFELPYAMATLKAGMFPDNTQLSTSDVSKTARPYEVRMMEDVKNGSTYSILDTLMSSGIKERFYATVDQFANGKLSPQEAAQKMYQDACSILK